MKKKNLWMMVTAVLTLITTIPAYAGTWKQDTIGWWYQNDDGSYLKNTWQWLDGNRDGIAESYCFDGNGYLLTNITTPDGYQVDGDGAWVLDGVVQRKTVEIGSGGSGIGSGSLGTTNENGYSVKRCSALWNKDVEGGTIYGYYDFTGWTTFDLKDTSSYKESKNYVIDGEFFCPQSIKYPDCALVEVQFDGDKLIKAIPVWVDNGRYDYGGFGNSETYIIGRREWREYEVSNPVYAEELKIQLVEEAKERAFEIYPDMIVDYTK